MLGIVAIALALGLVIVAAGIALDAAPVKAFVTRNVTSRPLGSLAPGYAATPAGYRVYSGLIRAFGITLVGLWAAGLGAIWVVVVLIGIGLFASDSVRAIRGEIATYRALQRR